jgi:hypothetical protein
MKTILATIALLLSLAPLARAAQETVGDKAHVAKVEAVETKREAGREVRHAGREVKKTARKARQAVITRCADGRHTIRGASGCAGHGGVVDPK